MCPCRSECKIIFRGPRSLGYGFVTFEKEADAQKALVSLKDVDLDGRPIKIEAASPRVPREEREPRPAARSGEARRPRGDRPPRAPRAEGDRPERERAPRRERKSHEGEIPSTTTVFVGNLPFSVVDQDLYNIFEAHHVVKAYVVRRSYNGASRGFGFVTFSEADQKKVLESMTQVICDDRELIIRAAYADPSKKEGEEVMA